MYSLLQMNVNSAWDVPGHLVVPFHNAGSLLKLIRKTEQYAESTLQYNYATQHRVRKKNHKNESIHNNKQHQITAWRQLCSTFDQSRF